jgi:uncharacterized membrane protein YqjE
MQMESNGNKLTKAAESLRQESETFDQQKRHDRLWFYLRLVMGYTAVVGLLSILVICVIIIFNSDTFPAQIVNWAGPSLFVDILGLIFTVWRVVLNPNFSTKLEPVTKKK